MIAKKTEMQVGKTYYIRTLTDHWVGRVVETAEPFLVAIEEASWVAESGRLSIFVTEGKAPGMEIEPVGFMVCRWESWIEWNHPLFKESQ